MDKNSKDSQAIQKTIEIKPSDIRLWLSSLEERGFKQPAIHAKLSELKSFFHYCLEKGLVKKDPTKSVHPTGEAYKVPAYLSNRQVAQLQELTRNRPKEHAIVELLYVTGLRIRELLSVTLEDINWETKTIWVKACRNDRYVLFTPECAESLKTYLNHRKDESEFLFSDGKGGPLSQATVSVKFNWYQKVLGFRVTPHMLRRTFLVQQDMKE